MTDAPPPAPLRAAIRKATLADETAHAGLLIEAADPGAAVRAKARTQAAEFVRQARARAARSGLIDKFLQEYGLSNEEGVTLMRLAEALLRTPDAATADALIKDKVEAGDWASHKGRSPFPLVNYSTRALMLTAAWLEENEGANGVLRATRSAVQRLGEPVIRASVAQAMRIMGEHFVLGETIGAALKRGQAYAAKGYTFSFDMLGEAAHTEDDAQRYFKSYSAAIAEIAGYAKNARVADNPGISVKLSALHPRYEYGKKDRVLTELVARTRALALAAKAGNMGFNIDAEESDRLDLSLDIFEALMNDPELAGWDGFGVVVQAYQRRAWCVLDWLADAARRAGRRVMVRLVKGAYWDSEIKRAQVLGLESYPVFTRKVLTDVSFLACARKMLQHTDVFRPQFATHNAHTAATVRELAGDYSDYELQRLHGMGEALHDQLLDKGAKSRIYAPVGGHRDLLPYLVRRLLENGANSSFVNQLFDPELSVDDVVADPVDEARALKTVPNPRIPAPRDTLEQGRRCAKGWDWTDPETAAALEEAVCAPAPDVRASSIVGGDEIGGDFRPVVNPARRSQTIGAVAWARAEDVDAACSKAAAAARDWAATPASVRAGVLRKAADLLEERGESFMRLAVCEAGKSIPDAIAEVREAIDFLRYYPSRAEELTRRTPLGVVACISPWNFPLAIFLGQASAALAAGNAVVAKPAEQTPLIAHAAVRLLHEAGAPVDALHLLLGDGPTIGGPLVAHPDVAGVVFTGSTETARAIARGLAKAGKADAPLIAETGGVNAMIIDSTALLEQAVRDVVASAFQSAGQRCSAARVVCVQEDVADRFNEMLAGAMAELSLGDPARLSVDVGPVIDEEARANIAAYVEDIKRRATVIAEAAAPVGDVDGTFVRPVAFELDDLDHVTREVFGPVLHVVRFPANDLEGAVEAVNARGYGLTMGLHTRIDETMERVARAAHVGNLYVNRNQIGAVVGVQPFGGEGLSGTGPKAGGPHYLLRLTRPEGGLIPGPSIAIADAPAPPAFAQAAARAREIAAAWRSEGRADVLEAAAANTAGEAADALRTAAAQARAVFAATLVLPGPTGESNTLRLRPRGVIACLGPDLLALHRQAARALAAGNAALLVSTHTGAAEFAAAVSGALAAAGAPAGLVRAIATDDAGVARGLLLADGPGGFAFAGAAESRRAIATVLAEREGALIPLLSAGDDAYRWAHERVLTVNTTAAGGDVRLMSLADAD